LAASSGARGRLAQQDQQDQQMDGHFHVTWRWAARQLDGAPPRWQAA